VQSDKAAKKKSEELLVEQFLGEVSTAFVDQQVRAVNQ
jgi:hypothetical protein